GTQLVDDVQGHADVAHQDLHSRLGVLVLEEELDPVFLAPLRGRSYAFYQPSPALAVRRLERIVVALDAGPDDEVRPQAAGHVGRGQRAPHRLGANRRIRRAQPAAAAKRVEMQTGGDTVDAVPAESVLDRRAIALVDLLRVVELVVVDKVADAGHWPCHLVDAAPAR